jgi:seryl-tRNA synthetase
MDPVIAWAKELSATIARAEKAEAELTNYKTALEIANSSADELVCRWRELRAEVERLKERLRIESSASAHALHWAEKAEDECLEQARLLGMSGSREASLLGKISQLERQLEKNNS